MRFATPWVILAVFLLPASARADLGTLRLSTEESGCRITVFTSPAPLRAGPVEVKVLLDRSVGDVSVRLRAQTGQRQVEAVAERVAPFHVAMLDLDRPGPWHIDVEVDSPRGPIRVSFNAIVEEPIPSWLELLPWIAWPILPIVLFMIHRALVRRARPALSV